MKYLKELAKNFFKVFMIVSIILATIFAICFALVWAAKLFGDIALIVGGIVLFSLLVAFIFTPTYFDND